MLWNVFLVLSTFSLSPPPSSLGPLEDIVASPERGGMCLLCFTEDRLLLLQSQGENVTPRLP